MNIRPISTWVLYKHRFFIAYTLLAILVGLLLSIDFMNLPSGLGASEVQAVVTSNSITFTQLPAVIVDLPYHALQKAGIELFGLSPLGVRLPSVVIGVLTALCTILIFRRWLPANTAIVAGAIIITSAWFLLLSRLGTPLIMIPFWTSLLFLAATHVSQQTRHARLAKVVFAIAASLSLYTPTMAYVFAAVFLAAFAQPHLRYLIRAGSKFYMTVGGFFFLLLLAPLAWGIYKDPSLIATLLALPQALPEPKEFSQGLLNAASNMFNPYNVRFGEMVLPAMSVATGLILLIGFWRILKDFHSVRSHVLLIWVALLIPIAGFNPHNLAPFIFPCMLVLAIGLQVIMKYWYRLFPLNPYARIFGFLPLAVLVVVIVQFNYQRYFVGERYNTTAFQPDAFMAQKEVTNLKPTETLTFVVSDAQKPLYNVLATVNKNKKVHVLNAGEVQGSSEGVWIVARSELSAASSTLQLPVQRQLVTDRAEDALRFTVLHR